MGSELQAAMIAVNASNTVASLVFVAKSSNPALVFGAMLCAGATGISVDLYRQSRAREHAR